MSGMPKLLSVCWSLLNDCHVPEVLPAEHLLSVEVSHSLSLEILHSGILFTQFCSLLMQVEA